MLDLMRILCAIEIAILAVILHRLIQPGMIFGFWGEMLARKQWDWPSWVRAPLGDCFTCFSGQVGLWSGIALEAYYQYGYTVIFEPILPWPVSAAFRLIFHIAFTIYFADILNFNAGRNQNT